MRTEFDSLGPVEIPDGAYYGVQSYRAMQNFPITGNKMLPEMIVSLAQIKKACAQANCEAGDMTEEISSAIVRACDEIIAGQLHDQFIVDPIQGGAGTSANMNANEVIASRATELLGGKLGEKLVHANDHVNMAQSTNDVYPSAGKLTTLKLIKGLLKALDSLKIAFEKKAEEFKDVIKLGRTQLQDAVPVHLGQEFGAYAAALERGIQRIRLSRQELYALNLGATAIGTCINTSPVYLKTVVPYLATETRDPFYQAKNLIDATQNPDGFVEVSAAVKNCALILSKISNDLRLMSSGPRGGLGEITLPARQHGSSIMPGKINPVMPEVVSQVAFRIAGNDVAIGMAAEAGQLELNAFEPVLFHCLFESITMLTNVAKVFEDYCIAGIVANVDRCKANLFNSTAMATALNPIIGYEAATKIVKTALHDNRQILDVAVEILEEKGMTKEQVEKIFDDCVTNC